METAIFDPSSAAASAGAGFICTIIASMFKSFLDMSKERQETLLLILKGKVELLDTSADKAALRDNDTGKLIRRMIYFGCAFTIIVAPFIFAFFPSIPVEVEQREVLGGWLWGMFPEWVSTTFRSIHGFYLPDCIQTSFISYLIPFYLGRGAAK